MPVLCSVKDLEEAYDAATALYAGGPLTVAGRALAKHNPLSRPGSAFPIPKGGPAEINTLAHEIVAAILSDGAAVKTERGAVYDITAPDRRGLHFHATGALKGFLEP